MKVRFLIRFVYDIFQVVLSYIISNLTYSTLLSVSKDVIRVSHRDNIKDLVRKGRIIERNVLCDALEAHLDNRVISHRNKCVVFSE